jgi:hypothetical protein
MTDSDFEIDRLLERNPYPGVEAETNRFSVLAAVSENPGAFSDAPAHKPDRRPCPDVVRPVGPVHRGGAVIPARALGRRRNESWSEQANTVVRGTTRSSSTSCATASPTWLLAQEETSDVAQVCAARVLRSDTVGHAGPAGDDVDSQPDRPPTLGRLLDA